MSIWKWLHGSLDGSTIDTHALTPINEMCATTVNPATGLPMLSGGMSGVDAGGSLYGMDSHVGTSWDSDIFSDSGAGSTFG